jgi:hypothetical protein
MPLYVAEHVHAPDHCRAEQPQAAAFLLKHLSDEEAKKHGIRIQPGAVARGNITYTSSWTHRPRPV